MPDAPAHHKPSVADDGEAEPAKALRELVGLARLVDSGQLHPQVGAVYPLADAREAFVAKSTQSIPGKVVLQP